MLLMANRMVWPSGSALATAAAPIMPVAPGRFSTMMGWPSEAASFSPISRVIASTLPPAASGTTMRIGLVG